MSPAIITGMHRSGTSAIARTVQALGVNLGSDLLPAGRGNVHGHFEENAFIKFHDRLIDRLFTNRSPFCEWLPLADTNATYAETDRAEAKSLWEAHHAASANAWKDPRTSLFLDLWTEVLPDAKVIVCLRHPYQVHRSLLRRGEPFLHADYFSGLAGSMVYLERILKVISTLPKDRFVVVDVESAFREKQRLAEGLAQFLGLPVTEKALEAIVPEDFNFEDDCGDAVAHFGDFFPKIETTYRQLRQFDLLHPLPFTPPAQIAKPPIGSDEARLIEFEETQGLREKTKKMLTRSIAVDRQRTIDYYKKLVQVEASKDHLIEDLTRLTAVLKRRVTELESLSEKLHAD